MLSKKVILDLRLQILILWIFNNKKSEMGLADISNPNFNMHGTQKLH